ncbi:MAG: hypothetical protein EBT71_05925 [Alphaproteobacteria bacterium]|nr:hypothetical protein [Alphaproteobacteria bacterium]
MWGANRALGARGERHNAISVRHGQAVYQKAVRRFGCRGAGRAASLPPPSAPIHADVNPDSKHLSSKYKNMISGYISGCGFDVKVKPLSFVASSIADQHTRKT